MSAEAVGVKVSVRAVFRVTTAFYAYSQFLILLAQCAEQDLLNCRASVHLSVPSFCPCGGFAAVGPAHLPV